MKNRFNASVPYIHQWLRIQEKESMEGINQRPNTTESRSLGKQRKRERERESNRFHLVRQHKIESHFEMEVISY